MSNIICNWKLKLWEFKLNVATLHNSMCSSFVNLGNLKTVSILFSKVVKFECNLNLKLQLLDILPGKLYRSNGSLKWTRQHCTILCLWHWSNDYFECLKTVSVFHRQSHISIHFPLKVSVIESLISSAKWLILLTDFG